MTTMNEPNILPASTELADRLSGLLDTKSFGRAVRWYESVSSTNILAAEWALADAPDGAVVCAELQTAGRGRFDRIWTAAAGENLTFSIVLFPGLSSDRLGMISVAFSVAVANLLRTKLGSGRVDIKWPNDILLDGGKVCGMLQESAFSAAGGSRRVVLGLGLNVNQSSFPAEIGPGVTSMRLAAGHEFDRVALLAELLKLMEDAYQALHRGRAATIRSRYETMLLPLGRQVTFLRMPSRENASGIVTGIDERGGLVISTNTGSETVFAGDVSMKTG